MNPPRLVGSLAPLPLGQGHTQGGRRGSRTLKAHRSTALEAGAIAHWLALPFRSQRLRWLDSNQRWGIRRFGLTIRSLLPARVHRNSLAWKAPSGSRTRTSAMARRQAAATSWAHWLEAELSKTQSTGRDSNPRRRRPPLRGGARSAVSCRWTTSACSVGPQGLEP